MGAHGPTVGPALVSPGSSRPSLLALLLVLLVSHATGGGLPCDGRCNGHGTCDFLSSKHIKRRACNCFPGYTGSDCSRRTCPTGKAWSGYSHTTDGAHDVDAECSGAGTCDERTGHCLCEPMYEGSACERMRCPGGDPPCSGHGICMSMREAARHADGVSLIRTYSYSLWDADRIFGCVCDEGFTGFDCLQRVCPSGADPMSVTADSLVPEVQTISCTCPGTCGGYLTASLYGKTTDPIYSNATALTSGEDRSSVYGGTGLGQSLQSRLETLSDKLLVKSISMPSAALCTSGGSTTTVTFLNGVGDMPLIYLDFDSTLTSNSVTKAGGASITVTISTTQVATTTPELCSHRGSCDYGEGTCKCITGFEQSDGSGASGMIGDCGHATNVTAVTACATSNGLVCNGHGVCSGTPKFRCACVLGWSGGDCSQRDCPMGRAWFDKASDVDTAHALAICSNAGTCDYGTGVCSCRDGFTGAACERIDCHRDPDGLECSGRGRCLTLRELAPLGRVLGDHPNAGRTEIQKIVCTLSSGSFELTFRHALTSSIAYNANAETLRTALESLYPITLVTVTFSPDNGAVCSASGETTFVEFTHNFGDLPLMTASSGSVVITEHRAGTRISYGDVVAKAATWDADQMRACHCDGYPDYNQSFASGDKGKWTGPSCNLRTCPVGTDPLAAAPLRYRITCRADGGTTALSFTGATGSSIGAATTASSLKTELESLSTVETAMVSITSGSTLCSLSSPVTEVWITTKELEHTIVALSATSASLTASSGSASVSVSLVSQHVGNENQTIQCSATGGTFTLSFRGHTTAAIPYDADEAALQAKLQDLATIGRVTVAMGGVSPKAVCAASAVSTVVTFSTQLGDVALMAADAASLSGGTASVSVTETDKGTTGIEECSGRGVCDRELGMCKCLASYVSGDGQTFYGPRGDCGHVDPLFAQTHPVEFAVSQLT